MEFAYVFAPRGKKKIDEIAIPMRFSWKTVYSYSADWAESIREHDPFQPQTTPPPKHTEHVDHPSSSEILFLKSFFQILLSHRRVLSILTFSSKRSSGVSSSSLDNLIELVSTSC